MLPAPYALNVEVYSNWQPVLRGSVGEKFLMPKTRSTHRSGVYCRFIMASMSGIAAWRITSDLRKWSNHGEPERSL